MQVRQAPLLRGSALTSSSIGKRREQRLRLSDLGHLRRRRKALERGREDGVGVGERPVDW